LQNWQTEFLMTPKLKPQLNICLLMLALSLLTGCATTQAPEDLPPEVEQQRINDLNHALLALDGEIDANEARRAALIAIEYTQQLALEYEITGSPIVHNLLVNLGAKPRGLCVDWTSDLLARLQQEHFYSLDLHWGIANYENAFRLEHSTVIVSARGDTLYRGLVLDPWRHSGQLFWAPTLQDSEYEWKPQAEIHAMKREWKDDNENHLQSR
jgi:hypothetical protein